MPTLRKNRRCLCNLMMMSIDGHKTNGRIHKKTGITSMNQEKLPEYLGSVKNNLYKLFFHTALMPIVFR